MIVFLVDPNLVSLSVICSAYAKLPVYLRKKNLTKITEVNCSYGKAQTQYHSSDLRVIHFTEARSLNSEYCFGKLVSAVC